MKKNKKVTLIIMILLVVSSISIYMGIKLNNKPKEVKSTVEDIKPPVVKEEPKKEEYELSLVMVGDALLHGAIYGDAYKNGVYDFTDQLKYIKEVVIDYDLAFYNQETILGGTELELSTYPRFNSPYEFGDAMIDAGFNLVSLANNHTLDRGEPAIINSSNYWKKQKDVLVSGSYASLEDQEEIKVKEVNGIKYTLLAYTTLTNGLVTPSGKEYFINRYSEDRVKRDLDKVKGLVDIVMVSMHWGAEYVHEPVLEQRQIAEYLSTLGVDIVIGHHPHVIQPVVKIKDTLVFYSLGNFISAQTDVFEEQRMVGLMSSIKINKTVEEDQINITVDNNDNELIYTHKNGNWTNVKVIPFRFMNENYSNNYKRLYEKYSNIVKMYDKNVIVRELSY